MPPVYMPALYPYNSYKIYQKRSTGFMQTVKFAPVFRESLDRPRISLYNKHTKSIGFI